MSAKAETLATPARPIASSVVALILTLVIGAAAGSLITQAVTSDTPAAAAQVVGITPGTSRSSTPCRAGNRQTVGWTVRGSPRGTRRKLDAMDGFQASAAARNG